MADVKISQLPAATTPVVGTEILPIVQSGVTAKVSINNATGITRPFTANGVLYASSTTALTSGSALTFDGTALAPDGTGRTLGTTALRWGTVYATAFSDGVDQLVGSSGAQTRFGYGAQWTSQAFAISGSEQMRLTSTGLGIGTSSPLSKLESRGTPDANWGNALLFDGRTAAIDQGGMLALGGYKTTTSAQATFGQIAARKENSTAGNEAGYLSLSVNNNTTYVERLRVGSSGIVTMSAYGAGTATFSAAGVISSVSDETWKTKDGVPVNPDAMLKKLEPGYWYYNDEKKESFGADRQLGFYAQNVNAAIGPEAAPEPEEGKPWGYYDRSVLAVVVMSLQKALSTIESLETRLAALEQK